MSITPSIQIYDPALCCASGVCGTDVDQALVSFAADAAWAAAQGAQITRFNLSQQPLEFAHNATVKRFLERSGAEALPLVLVDGEVALAGRYPPRAELARWAGLKADAAPPSGGCCGSGAAPTAAGACCVPRAESATNVQATGAKCC